MAKAVFAFFLLNYTLDHYLDLCNTIKLKD